MNAPTKPTQSTSSTSGTLRFELRICPLIVFLCLSFLSGCAIGPDYRRPEIDAPPGWRLEQQTAVDLTNTAWWEQFQDPVLTDLIGIALRENRDLRIASARVDEFQGRLQAVRSGLFPQIGYAASATRTSQSLEDAVPVSPGTGRRYTTDVIAGTASWEIDLWGRLRRATEAAQAELLSAEEGRRAVILTLVSEVARGYIELLTLDKILLTARQTLEAREAFQTLFQKKFDGGQVSAMELAQVKSAYEQVAQVIPELERRIIVQENALSVLLGRNPGGIRRGRTLDQLVMPAVPQGLPSELLTRRPDIRAIEQDLIAANARIGVARAQYFPSISLTGILGAASTALSSLFDETAAFWQASAAADGLVFTGGRLKGENRQAEARQQQMLQAYLRAVQTAFKEVEDALVGVQKFREILTARERHGASLHEYARSAQNRYDARYGTYIEVLDAESRLFNNQVDYVQTRQELFGALINTYKAMGGGWVNEASRQILLSGLNTTSPASPAGDKQELP